MERGTLLQGEELEIIGNSNDTLHAAAMQLQLFGRNVESILTGDVAGVLLNGISRDDIHRGMVLAKPGTVRAYTRFEAYMDFGQMRRSSILFSGREAEFFFRTASVRGRIITRNDDAPGITCGEHRTVIIELHKPVAVAEGLRFIMMDKVWIIATGRITRILE